MTLYKSDIQLVDSTPQLVFDTLSDLRNLENSRHLIPENSIQDVEFHEDKCLFSIPPLGKIELYIQEKIPATAIRFNSDNAPIDFHLIINIEPMDEGRKTQLQVEVHADLPQMVKMMFNGKIQQFVNQFATAIGQIHYA
ncbi:hypothetical protein [Microbacter margulisiae]|uniref:Polyketide cyclase / dehydrase and lipid transport n=1 Tax=Microbacter margulisiae TaxID=1350067 RepID=A0A7W5H2W1_9PORP|nr:hypothetical protein [Microbacter margulisiae]MBB3187787.1 hypothetical protein [Microbacter margulisiae]